MKSPSFDLMNTVKQEIGTADSYALNSKIIRIKLQKKKNQQRGNGRGKGGGIIKKSGKPCRTLLTSNAAAVSRRIATCPPSFSQIFTPSDPVSNQIRVVALNVPQLTSFIFTKKSNLAKWLFDICNAEMAQSLSSLQKSEFLKLIISFFHYFWCQN